VVGGVEIAGEEQLRVEVDSENISDLNGLEEKWQSAHIAAEDILPWKSCVWGCTNSPTVGFRVALEWSNRAKMNLQLQCELTYRESCWRALSC